MSDATGSPMRRPYDSADASAGAGTVVLDLRPEQIEPVHTHSAIDVLELGSAMEIRPSEALPARPKDPFVRIKNGTPAARTPANKDAGPPRMPKMITAGWDTVFASTSAELDAQLDSARSCAAEAARSQDRTNTSLYKAISAAYDLALIAREAPEMLGEMLARQGIAVQQRAPMTPIVKLVFGVDYDKTRVAEYAATLEHAGRQGIRRGALEGLLTTTPGGVKAFVRAARMLRLADSGRQHRVRTAPRSSIARILRAMPRLKFEEIAPEGDEFALVLIRRSDRSGVQMIGEVPRNVSLIEKAAAELLKRSD